MTLSLCLLWLQNCSNFQAASVIRSKNKTAKLEFTGVFASVCNHDFPFKILSMRYGERYIERSINFGIEILSLRYGERYIKRSINFGWNGITVNKLPLWPLWKIRNTLRKPYKFGLTVCINNLILFIYLQNGLPSIHDEEHGKHWDSHVWPWLPVDQSRPGWCEFRHPLYKLWELK